MEPIDNADFAKDDPFDGTGYYGGYRRSLNTASIMCGEMEKLRKENEEAAYFRAKAKRHHVVIESCPDEPDFYDIPGKGYLGGFTAGRFLWAYDVNDKRMMRLPVKTAAVRNQYQSFVDVVGNKATTIRNPLFPLFEDGTIKTVQKLLNRQPIASSDRLVISLFVESMLRRTVAFERLNTDIADEAHRFRSRFLLDAPEILEAVRKPPPDYGGCPPGTGTQEFYECVQQGDYAVAYHLDGSLDLASRFAVEFAPLLASLNWIVGHAPANAAFLTSDAPFVISAPPDFPSELGLGRGIVVSGVTYAIPLSRRLCLYMRDRGGGFVHCDLSADAVRKTNLAIASRAQRFIMSSSKSLLEGVAKKFAWKAKKKTATPGVPIPEELYRNREQLLNEFRKELAEDSTRRLLQEMTGLEIPGGPPAYLTHEQIRHLLQKGIEKSGPYGWTPEVSQANSLLEAFITPERRGRYETNRLCDLLWFIADCRRFDIRSSRDVAFWMFHLKRLKPLRATWENDTKVHWDLVPDAERDWHQNKPRYKKPYTPTVDERTLKFYAETDPAVAKLVRLRALFRRNCVPRLGAGDDRPGV